jgi:hypothetical protein
MSASFVIMGSVLEGIGVTPYVPKPLTSGSKAKGRFGKQDFVYLADDDVYRCPAGETLTRRFTLPSGHWWRLVASPCSSSTSP